MYCLKCECEITSGTLCHECGFENDNPAALLFPAEIEVKHIMPVINMDNDQFEIVDNVLLWYKGEWSVAVIPYGVKKIGARAFSGKYNLTGVVIPDSVIEIDEYAFWGCSFTSVDLPPHLRRIGKNAFGRCSKLTSVTIPDSVIEIGSGAFSFCRKLVNVSIGSNTILPEGVFEGCNNLSNDNIIRRKAEPKTEVSDYKEKIKELEMEVEWLKSELRRLRGDEKMI